MNEHVSGVSLTRVKFRASPQLWLFRVFPFCRGQFLLKVIQERNRGKLVTGHVQPYPCDGGSKNWLLPYDLKATLQEL